MTIVSPVKRWWAWWLRISWPGAQHLPIVKAPLERLSFINFGFWGLWDRNPAGDRRGPRLVRPMVIFQTNFNGPLDAYVGAFVHVVPYRIALLWGGAYGFPGPRHPGRLYEYALSRTQPVQHFYCAYPEGSATMIVNALALQERFAAFRREHRDAADEAFAEAYREFLADVQGLL